jgi:peptidoglycan/xylan/chitin deacetylase (PgdA/CDA1 family)
MLAKIWNRMFNVTQKKAVILMYHQVCEKKSDPWELAVHPENFEAQLRYLKKNFDVVPVDELAQCVRGKRLRANMAAITFDDGFADNYTNAAPLLEWYALPASFYLATDPIKHPKYYWWDELQSIILHTQQLPVELQLAIGDELFRFHLKRNALLNARVQQEIQRWTYGMRVPNERIDLYLELWRRIQPLPHGEQQAVLERLRIWSGLTCVTCTHGSTMQISQMLKLSRTPLFSIGAHTVHHAMLARQKESDQKFEIEESKKVMEGLLGKPVKGFAYPYGNYDAVTKSLLLESGFQYAVSTDANAVTVEADPFALPRFQVKNWKAEEFSLHLHQLLNL